MTVIQTLNDYAGLFGGAAGLGLLARWIYTSLSKTHRRAVDADTTRDLVNIATSLLEPSEKIVERLSARLAEEEARAEKLSLRIEDLEASALAREKEMGSLNT